MLVVAISLVWITEALNTAVEFIVDMASPDFHPLAMKAKDVAAAAVLIASITAIMIGILIIINECKIY
jgi:diacylglycerol kinase (ATP)